MRSASLLLFIFFKAKKIYFCSHFPLGIEAYFELWKDETRPWSFVNVFKVAFLHLFSYSSDVRYLT